MTKADWQKESIVSSWTDANGSPDWPFGDAWRMALINPIVFDIAQAVQRGFDPVNHGSLYTGLARQRQKLASMSKTRSAITNLVSWHHASDASAGTLSDVRLLDLGCGEAYRSRWLGRQGVSYIGVDCSPGMIEKALCRRKTDEYADCSAIAEAYLPAAGSCRRDIGSSGPVRCLPAKHGNGDRGA